MNCKEIAKQYKVMKEEWSKKVVNKHKDPLPRENQDLIDKVREFASTLDIDDPFVLEDVLYNFRQVCEEQF